jgi:hypothetical protein
MSLRRNINLFFYLLKQVCMNIVQPFSKLLGLLEFDIKFYIVVHLGTVIETAWEKCKNKIRT